MGQRRFGPVSAAGVAIVEQTSGQAIQAASMGIAAQLGVFESGKPNDYTSCPSLAAFHKKMGGRISSSTCPDAAEDYFAYGQGAGELLCVRVTDGTEVTPYIDLFTRHWGTDFYANVVDKDGQIQIKTPCLRISAKNGGRWGGRQRYLRSEVPTNIATDLTETTINTGLTMLLDEWAGATVRLDGVTGKTYEVVSNTTAGVVSVKSDSQMLTDMGGSVDKDYELELTNLALATGGNKGLAVSVIEGQNPATQFGLKVYRDGALVRTYPALSMDPAAAYYVEPMINDDTGNDEIVVTDLLPTGITILPDHRPANYYGRLKSLTATKATFNIAQVVQVDDPTNVKVVGIALPAGADPWPHRLTFTWEKGVVHKYHVTVTPLGQKSVYMGTYSAGVWSLLNSDAWAGAKLAGVYTAGNIHTVTATFDHVAEPDTGKAVVIDVLPVPDNLPVGGTLAPVAKTKNLTRFNVSASDYESVTCDSASMSAVASAFAAASVTGANEGPFAVNLNNKLLLAMDGMSPDVEVTLTTGVPGSPIAANIVTDINARFNALYGAAVYNPASTPDGTHVVLSSPGRAGKWSKIQIKTIANDAYAVLGFTVGTTYGAFGQAPEVASVTGNVPDPGPYVVIGLKLKIRIDSRTAGAAVVEVTFDANKTAAQAVSFINGAFATAWGASPAPVIASVYVNPAGQSFVKLSSPWHEGGGPSSTLELLGVAGHCYNVFGFVAGTAVAPTQQKVYGVSGDEAQAFYADEPGGGYDGGIPVDQDYIDMLSVSASPLRKLADKGKGVVSIACPDVTSSAVQKAGYAFCEAHNHHYLSAFPASLADEQSIIDWMNDTLGRSDFATPFFPSFAKVNDQDKTGVKKLIPQCGAIQGLIARYAKNYGGYHWPAAGIEAKLYRVVELPDALIDVELNEELLTPQGVNVLKLKHGNYVVWGARTQWVNTDWQFLTHRLQMSHYEHTLQENFDWVIFQLNDKSLWAVLKTSLRTFFQPEFAKGAMKGKNFDDACVIKIDEENNTAITEASGDLNVELGLKFPFFAERLILTVGKQGVFEGTSS